MSTGAIILLLYACTAAPGLTWANNGADGGDLITAAMTWGVPHPSGYPVYCLLARAFAWLPLGNIARRFNLYSASMAAISVVFLSKTAYRWLGRVKNAPERACLAVLISLVYGTGQTLWSQATITEVYTSLSCFFSLGLYLHSRPNLGRPGYWAAVGLAMGLGLGIHLTLALTLPGLLVLGWPQMRFKGLGMWCLGVAIGLLSYAYIPIAAQGDSPLIWGAPTQWQSFWWLISGRLYRSYAFALPRQYVLVRLGAWLRLWSGQYTVVGLGLGLLGVWSLEERRRWTAVLGSALTVLSCSLFAIGYDTRDSLVYLLPCYAVTALWLAEGLQSLLFDQERIVRSHTLSRWLGVVLLVAICSWSVIGNYESLDLGADREATDWVDAVEEILPEDALFITGSDKHHFAMDYVVWVAGRRGDLRMVDDALITHAWYRAQQRRRYPQAETIWAAESIPDLLDANIGERRVFISIKPEALPFGYTAVWYDPVWEITVVSSDGQ